MGHGNLWWLGLLLAVVAMGCKGDDPADDDSAGDDDDVVQPFAEYCGDTYWEDDLTPATVGEKTGDYAGYYSSQNIPEGTYLAQKVIPDHPFQVTGIRVAFAGSGGPVTVRLTTMLGHSYAAVGVPEDAPVGDLMDPVEVDVDDPDGDDWFEIDVADAEIFLTPNENYTIVVEQTSGGPYVAMEDIPEGELNLGLMLIPGEYYPFGTEGNFRMELVGNYYCNWDERWFAEDTGQPIAEVSSSRAGFTDIDSDGVDDLILHSGGPVAYLGDGAGGFVDPGFDPFPDATGAGLAVFGDVDNDGDVDAFAGFSVSADGDQDGVSIAEGDCNDTDQNVGPNEDELFANGIDDDCDEIADDGTDTSDGDGDGYSIADGDCHDVNPAINPGALEMLDNGWDDDCDGTVDDGTDIEDADGDTVAVADGDCDDADPAVYPGATEVAANGIDDDCDGLVDDGTDVADVDGDGVSVFAGDCNDANAAIVPGGLEILDNGIDDDCDGQTDDGTDMTDADGDGTPIAWTDCDDNDPDIRPSATDGGDNGVDDDCDGQADSGTDMSDADGDGVSIAQGDCDDTRDNVYPGAPEAHDAMDNDCDQVADDDYVNRILLNDGTGLFSVVETSGVEALDQSTTGAFGDGNGDGNLDLYWGNWLRTYPYDRAEQDRYFEGNGDGTFVDRQEPAGLVLDTAYSVYGIGWIDYNDDGLQDIYVSNYHLYPNQLWENQGDGTFIDVAEDKGAAYDDIPNGNSDLTGGHSYGGDWGDIDNDGDMDAFVCNLAHPRDYPWADPSMMLVNNGAPDYTFDNRFADYGFVYDEGDENAAFADFDHDMDLDIYVASLYQTHFGRFYRNDGEDGFTDVTYQTGVHVHRSITPVWSDIDNDGDLDLVVAAAAGTPYVHLFVNQLGQDSNWLQLRLEGTSGNREALGARVTLTAGGVTQMREVQGHYGSSYSHKSNVVHFGLADVGFIDELTIRWPGGSTETIGGLEINHRYDVVEGAGTGEEVF